MREEQWENRKSHGARKEGLVGHKTASAQASEKAERERTQLQQGEEPEPSCTRGGSVVSRLFQALLAAEVQALSTAQQDQSRAWHCRETCTGSTEPSMAVPHTETGQSPSPGPQVPSQSPVPASRGSAPRAAPSALLISHPTDSALLPCPVPAHQPAQPQGTSIPKHCLTLLASSCPCLAPNPLPAPGSSQEHQKQSPFFP